MPGREFAPYAGWSALTSAFFFSVPDALGVKRVAGQPRCGRLEGVEFTALQQHDEKNYFSGNTL